MTLCNEPCRGGGCGYNNWPLWTNMECTPTWTTTDGAPVATVAPEPTTTSLASSAKKLVNFAPIPQSDCISTMRWEYGMCGCHQDDCNTQEDCQEVCDQIESCDTIRYQPRRVGTGGFLCWFGSVSDANWEANNVKCENDWEGGWDGSVHPGRWGLTPQDPETSYYLIDDGWCAIRKPWADPAASALAAPEGYSFVGQTGQCG